MATVNVTISPAIENVFIVLEDKTLNTCQSGYTNASGQISFLSLPAGPFSVYNVGEDDGNCPPQYCTFPEGYSGTRDPRRKDFTLAATTNRNETFRYDKPVLWSVANGGNPPTFAMTTNGGIDLATGEILTIGNISNNGMGYCMQDNIIYGSSGRSAFDGNYAVSYPFSYTTSGLIGCCDDLGHFYSPAGTNRVTCIDVNGHSPSYLRALDPYNNFSETTSPFYVSYTAAAGSALSSADWSYVPNMQSIVGVDGTEIFILSITAPSAHSVPVIGSVSTNVTGISFSDNKNFYMPSGSQIKKFFITPTVAIGEVLTSSSISISGDGCRAVGAPVFYAAPQVVKAVDKTLAAEGDTLMYTVTIVNTGVTDGLTSVFRDTLPDGVTFVPDSMYLNEVQQVGLNPNFLDIGSLPIGEYFTITFSANITSTTILEFLNDGNVNATYYDSATEEIFDTTFESNIVATTIIGNYISTAKYVDKTIGQLGEIVTYTLVTTNLGTTIATGVSIIDTIPEGTEFVIDSLIVNGTNELGQDVLPPTGYLYGDLNGGEVITTSFSVSVESLPKGDTLINYGTSAYTSITGFGTVNFLIDSNTVATVIRYADFGTIEKSVDKEFGKPGDEIEYTIVIPNTGNAEGINILFTDTIPNGTSYVVGSLEIDGVLSGETFPTINLGNIPAGGVKTIIYRVLID